MRKKLIVLVAISAVLASHPALVPNHADRFSRDSDGDSFENAVSKMQMLSLVTSGIVIQRSINKGFSASGEVISELLRMGSLHPSKIDELNLADIGKMLDTLENFSKRLNENAGVEKMKQFYFEIADIAEAIRMEPIWEWSAESDFKKDLQSMTEREYPKNAVQEIRDFLNEIDKYTENLGNDSIAEATRKSNLAAYANGCSQFMELFSSFISNLFKFDNIESAESAFSNVSRSASLVRNAVTANDRLNFSFVLTAMKQHKANIKYVSEVAADIKLVISDLGAIADFFDSRNSGNAARKLIHTVGLPNGYEDLNSIETALKDPWMKEIAKIPELSSVLLPLKTLRNVLKRIDTSLGNRFTGQTPPLLRSVVECAEKAQIVSANIKQIEDVLSALYTCGDTFTRDSIPTESIQQVEIRVKAVDDAIRNLRRTFEPEPEGLQLLTEVVEKYSDSEKIKDNGVEEFLKSGLNKNVIRFLVSLETNLTIAESKYNEVKPSVKELIGQFGVIEAYRKSLKASEYFPCLQKQAEQGTILLKAAEASVQNFRSLSSQLDDVRAIVTKMKAAQSDFEPLKAMLGQLNISKVERKALEAIAKIDKVSFLIGSATSGVVKMKEVSAHPVKFDGKWAEMLARERKKVGKMNSTDEENLNKIGLIGVKLRRMNEQLDMWKKGFGLSDQERLRGFAPLFTDAEPIVGVDIDLLELSGSVANLEKAIRDARPQKWKRAAPSALYNLQSLKKELATLAGLGLNFSDYTSHFSQSESALVDVEKIFTKYAVIFYRESHADDPPRNLPGPPKKSEESEESENSETPSVSRRIAEYGFFTIGSFLIMAILAVIIWFEFLRKRYRKRDKYRRRQIICEEENLMCATQPPITEDSELIVRGEVAVFFIDVFLQRIKRKGKQRVTNGKLELDMDLIKGFEQLVESVMAAADSETDVGDAIDRSPYEQEMRYPKRFQVHATKVSVTPEEGLPNVTPFYHANYVTFPNETRMILAEAPQTAGPGKVETLGKFNLMAKQHDVGCVVMLCRIEENGKNACGQYFSSEKGKTVCFDGGEVKCVNKHELHDGGVIIRDQIVTFKSGAEYSYKHVQYTEWPEHWVPAQYDVVLNLLNMIKKNSRDPVLVHSSAGVGRAGTFAFIEYCYQKLAKSGPFEFNKLLIEFRMFRSGAVSDNIQLGFAINALMEYILQHATDEEKKKSLHNRTLISHCYDALEHVLAPKSQLPTMRSSSGFSTNPSSSSGSSSLSHCEQLMRLYK